MVFVYAPSQAFYETFRKHSVGFPASLLPEWHLRDRAFRHFMPNNLLRSLENKGEIRLRSHPLAPSPLHGAEAVPPIPTADVWVFALLSDSHEVLFSEEFFSQIRARAKRENVSVINLTSHAGSLPVSHPTTTDELPVLAKLLANGLTTPGDPDSFALLTTQEEMADWKERTGPNRLTRYELQPYIEHCRNPEFSPYRCIERWICVCGDLTVGLRLSPDLIVKQLNSLTYYIRDPRKLEQEYASVHKQSRQRRGLARDGPLHLSFAYMGSVEYWDRRHLLYRNLQRETGFEIGTMDVLEDVQGRLHIIDYNEWTYESARKDLSFLWEAALLDAIHRPVD